MRGSLKEQNKKQLLQVGHRSLFRYCPGGPEGSIAVGGRWGLHQEIDSCCLCWVSRAMLLDSCCTGHHHILHQIFLSIVPRYLSSGQQKYHHIIHFGEQRFSKCFYSPEGSLGHNMKVSIWSLDMSFLMKIIADKKCSLMMWMNKIFMEPLEVSWFVLACKSRKVRVYAVFAWYYHWLWASFTNSLEFQNLNMQNDDNNILQDFFVTLNSIYIIHVSPSLVHY